MSSSPHSFRTLRVLSGNLEDEIVSRALAMSQSWNWRANTTPGPLLLHQSNKGISLKTCKANSLGPTILRSAQLNSRLPAPQTCYLPLNSRLSATRLQYLSVPTVKLPVPQLTFCFGNIKCSKALGAWDVEFQLPRRP